MSGYARLLADIRTYAAVACILAFTCVAPAATIDRLPTAGQVLDRYVRLTGGTAAWRAKRVERDDIEGRTLDGRRVVLRAAVTVSRSGNSISEIQIPQSGSEGIYKGVAWALSHFSGVRIKRGTEHEEAILDARMLEEADWRALYPNPRVAGIETIGDERCYKVLLLPSSTERIEWFGIASGLLVKRSSSELSPGGDTPVGYTVEEWAERDGIKQPSIMLAWRGDLQYRLSILSTEYNPKHADLQYPSEVADYLKAERAGKALPNAEEIVERHIFESGGPEFYEMLRTQKITGKLTFVAQNIEGRMETLAAGGGKYYQSTDIPGMGKQEEGSDGEIAWDRSPAIGPRLKPRKNAAALGVTLDAVGMVEWRLLIDHVQTEAEERINDRDCYRIRMTPRDGSQDMIRWYDRNTGLLYRSELALRTDMGDLPVVMTIEEYRDVAGTQAGVQTQVKWPSRVRITASGQDTLFSADEVKLNEPVDDAVFQVPDEIRDLARKKAEAESITP
ncbi:MAG TPA: hypothetical protein VHY84_23210 [Bryobacteraceae bacterium]|nr:hypothetical protein [Bryobacteraceae bacterium]